MKISIVGGGSIGGVLAAALIQSGANVSIVDVNQKLLQHISCNGLKITNAAIIAKDLGGKFHKPDIVTSDFRVINDADIVFVCTKVTAQEQVAANLKLHWRDGITVVSMQNGIDAENILAEFAGHDHTLRVSINYAASMVESGVYKINWFTKANSIGALTEPGIKLAQEVADILSNAKLITKVVNNIRTVVYEKTLLNASMCPICTLTGLTMSEVIEFGPTKELVIAVLEEGRLLGEKMGINFTHSINDWLEYLKAGGAHKTSMAEDMFAGRKTEIYYMNGKICEYGEKLGIATPYNIAMTLAVLGKEKSRRI